MRALSNLINVNTPNLVLFVGEALVGNDAVDQLVKFNRWAAARLLSEGAEVARQVLCGSSNGPFCRQAVHSKGAGDVAVQGLGMRTALWTSWAVKVGGLGHLTSMCVHRSPLP